MGFWYTDPQDHTGAWYWIGIAITLSQTLGLHRSPEAKNRNQRFSDTQQPLIRMIWWSCVVRDSWLSLAKGRPLRIHHEDCDIHLPRPEDLLSNLESIPTHIREKFVPNEMAGLVNMWINLVNISASLGKILRIHYRVTGSKARIEDVNTSYEELLSCKPGKAPGNNVSDLLVLHACHVDLFYEYASLPAQLYAIPDLLRVFHPEHPLRSYTVRTSSANPRLCHPLGGKQPLIKPERRHQTPTLCSKKSSSST